MEIERKFLINKLPQNIELAKYYKKEIQQIYLYIDDLSIIRIRKVKENDKEKYTYTVKTGKVGISNEEYENEISKDEFNKLYNNRNKNYLVLNKTRYIIPYIDNLKIELDVFHEDYDGLIFAEIEFKSEEQAENTKVPEWFGKDISKIITNSDLAMRNIDNIK